MSRKSKKKDANLPYDQWWCVWCDGRPPARTFESREHVISEGLGGQRDFRHKRGVVCDQCNRGFLKTFDEEMQMSPLVGFLRVHFGLGPPFTEIGHGLRFDRHQRSIVFMPSKFHPNDRVTITGPANADFTAGGPGEIIISTSGPSDKARSEHLGRGLHRIAYNAITHARGPHVARNQFGWLRDQVKDLTRIGPRAFLIDLQTLEAQARQSWGPPGSPAKIYSSNYAILPPDLMQISLGPALFYLSLDVSTAPLSRLKSSYPWLHTFSVIDPP